jgi:hypothetical protein
MTVIGISGSDYSVAPIAASAVSPSTATTPSSSPTPEPQAATAAMLANTVPVLVKASPRINDFNRPFVNVTLCVPGTTVCQSIDNVLLDTGSSGFRVLQNVLSPALKLPQVADHVGRQVGQCALRLSGAVAGKAQSAVWGSVRKADLKIAGMVAHSLSIEVVTDPAFPSVPNGCRNAADKVTIDFGFNGILGVRGFDADCGIGCANGIPAIPRYYGCASDTCSGVTLPVEEQVRNPVALFGPGYDNGVVITLPAVDGASNVPVQGAVTFGIGTRANNQLGHAKVFKTDGSGLIATIYGGTQVRALLDTGNPYIAFHDPDIQRCTAPASTNLYCLATVQQNTAINQSTNGMRDTVTVTITQPTSKAPVQAGSFGRYVDAGTGLTWGLPFYFGRTVFTAIDGKSTPAGTGPYIAY